MTNRKKVRWAGHVACLGELRSTYKVLFGKLERNPLVRPWRGFEDNIKMDI
jgi:hypothetical protein